MNRRNAVMAVLAAAVLFGTTGTSQALADAGASPTAVGAARIVLGGAALAAIGLFKERLGRMSLAEAAAAGVGALGVVAYQPLFFAGTRANGVAIGTVIALGSAPLITGLADALLRRVWPSRWWALATLLSLAGVALVSGITGGGSLRLTGVLSSVGAGASYALYTLASKRLLDLGRPPAHAMGLVFGLAAVLSVPLALSDGTAWLSTGRGIALIAWLGLATTALAYVLFGWGLGRLPAPTVATLTLLEPLTATVLGIAVLGERIAPVPACGLALLAVGIGVLAVASSRQARGEAQRLAETASLNA